MATQLQIRRGTAAQVAAFTGAEGEIVYNSTNDSLHTNDGATAGGFELARADLNNVSDADLNAALTGNTLSALTITTLTAGAATFSGTVTAGGLVVDGNVAVGLPSTNTWSTGYALEIGTEQAAIWGAGDQIDITGNAYFNSGWKAAATKSGASKYEQALGTHNFAVSGAVTADSAITFKSALNIAPNGDISFYEDTGTTAKFFWDASAESLGIGTSGSPVEKLFVNSTSGDARIGLNAPTGSDTEIKFFNNGTVDYSIGHDDATDNFVIGTANVDTPLMSVTKAGNVIFAASGGAIKSIGGDVSLVQGAVGLRINDSGLAISPTTSSANSDATTDLGVSNIRFKDLYLSGGVYLGGTGAANKLDDYEEGSFTATASQGTIQNTYCKYIKVGNLVTVSGNVDVFSDRTSSTPIAISGLPFAVKSGNLATTGVLTDSISGSASTHVYAGPGNTSMTLYQSNTSAALSPVLYSQLTSVSSGFYFTFTYTTA